ncbi:MAG TPA: hypothetical protein VNC61_07110 [Acidimicrobiales bacterium]|nr:hypothetical protein [Acidimicrobiales bacterium]
MTKSITKSTRRGCLRLATLTVVLSVSLLGVSSVAQAKPAAHRHHHHHGGGGAGGGTGAPAPLMAVTASPNPLVETGPSLIMTVVQVTTSPSLAGDLVNVSSSQMAASCGLVYFVPFRGNFGENVILTLDNEGNATVEMVGEDCAPGTDVIEADLMFAPYDTALTTLTALPPVVTPEGVTGYPNPEVETGDANGVGNNNIGNSDVFAVFYVETNPVYAEQSVEIGSAQLEASCTQGWVWISPNPGGLSRSGIGVNAGLHAQAILDDDGNAVFGFFGTGCATGTSQVIADVEAGSHPTYVTAYTVDPPAPMI